MKLFEKKISKKRGMIMATLKASSLTECIKIKEKRRIIFDKLLTPVKIGSNTGPEYLARTTLKKTTDIDTNDRSSFLKVITILW